MKYAGAAFLAASLLLMSSAAAQTIAPQPQPHAQVAGQSRLAAVAPRPDLRFLGVFLRAEPNGPAVTRIRRGHRYWVCFAVANGGAVASGPFRVAGGGLGIPFNPHQDHAGLAPGASRRGCLVYPTTPPPGVYWLGLTVDSLNAVAESNEANNNRTIQVTIVP